MDYENGSFRPRKVYYSPVSNTALQDTSLSLKAKGLYALIQSYINIPGYTLHKWYLMKICREKERAFNSIWKELKDAGYLKQYRMPGKDRGRFRYEYELLDIPDLSSPNMVTLGINGMRAEHGDHTLQNGGDGEEVNTDSESPAHTMGENQEAIPLSEDDFETEPDSDPLDHTPRNAGDGSDHTLQNAPYGPCTVCSMHGVQNVGGKNKIEFNKNELNKTKSVSQSKDGPTDEIRERFRTQIDYEYFADSYPEDLSGIDVLIDCMADMYVSPSTKINGEQQNRVALIPYIERVDTDTVRDFIDHMRGKSFTGVKNISAYWKSSFINYLREQELIKLSV